MKRFHNFDVYNHHYTYDEAKVLCLLGAMPEAQEFDYEDLMSIADAVYWTWIDSQNNHGEEQYHWLAVQGKEECGYIQAYAQRTLPEFIKLYKERNNIAQFIEKSVEWLQKNQAGCCHYKLDDHLAIYVGWSAGYGHDKDDDIIQAEDDLDFAINAGIKVWTSDYMQTDYDYINFPYYKNGTVIDMDMAIVPNEDYDWIAGDMLQWYEDVKDLVLDDDGLILEDENND